MHSEFADRSRSNSGALLSGRLRAASKMHQDGVLSVDEKAKMKTLILSQDPSFKEAYEQAERTGNWNRIKDQLKRGHWDGVQRTMSVDMINELAADVGLGEEEYIDVFSSNFFDNFGAPAMGINNRQLQQQQAGLHSGMPAPTNPEMLAPQGNKANIIDTSSSSKLSRKREASQSMPSQDRNKVMPPSRGSVSIPSPISSMHPLPPAGRGARQDIDLGSHLMGSHEPQPGGSLLGHLPSTRMEPVATGRRAPTSPPQPRRTAPKQAPMEPPKPISKQKVRKNERERKRRLAVSQGFEELYKLLNIPETQKLDKATILKTTIERIQDLESEVAKLEQEHHKLLEISNQSAKPVGQTAGITPPSKQNFGESDNTAANLSEREDGMGSRKVEQLEPNPANMPPLKVETPSTDTAPGIAT